MLTKRWNDGTLWLFASSVKPENKDSTVGETTSQSGTARETKNKENNHTKRKRRRRKCFPRRIGEGREGQIEARRWHKRPQPSFWTNQSRSNFQGKEEEKYINKMESCFCVVIFYYYYSYWAFGLFRLPFNVCISFGVGWSKILQDQLLSRLNLSGLSLINNFDANYNTQTHRHTRRWSHRTSDRESHWAHENCLLLHSLIHTTTTMRVQRTMTIDDLFFLFLIFIFFSYSVRFDGIHALRGWGRKCPQSITYV